MAEQLNPWDRPALAVSGDTSDVITFAAVGRALTAWEEFEHNFAFLFSRFIGTNTDELPASRAYGAVLTFKSRVAMVEAAAEAFFFLVPVDPTAAQTQQELKNEILGSPGHPKGKRRTQGLIDEAAQLAGRRNEIAHGIVRRLWRPNFAVFNTTALNESNAESWGFAIIPSVYATKNNTLKPTLLAGGTIKRESDYRYSSVEIDAFAEAFKSIRNRAAAISVRLHNHAKDRGPTTFHEKSE